MVSFLHLDGEPTSRPLFVLIFNSLGKYPRLDLSRFFPSHTQSPDLRRRTLGFLIPCPLIFNNSGFLYFLRPLKRNKRYWERIKKTGVRGLWIMRPNNRSHYERLMLIPLMVQLRLWGRVKVEGKEQSFLFVHKRARDASNEAFFNSFNSTKLNSAPWIYRAPPPPLKQGAPSSEKSWASQLTRG